MPASFTAIEIKGSLGKQKLKLTYLYTAESVRMRTVLKFLNHLLPQSYWSIMVLFTFCEFFLNKTGSYYFWEPNELHLQVEERLYFIKTMVSYRIAVDTINIQSVS